MPARRTSSSTTYNAAAAAQPAVAINISSHLSSPTAFARMPQSFHDSLSTVCSAPTSRSSSSTRNEAETFQITKVLLKFESAPTNRQRINTSESEEAESLAVAAQNNSQNTI